MGLAKGATSMPIVMTNANGNQIKDELMQWAISFLPQSIDCKLLEIPILQSDF